MGAYCHGFRAFLKQIKLLGVSSAYALSKPVLFSFLQQKPDFLHAFTSPECGNGAWPSHATATKEGMLLVIALHQCFVFVTVAPMANQKMIFNCQI